MNKLTVVNFDCASNFCLEICHFRFTKFPKALVEAINQFIPTSTINCQLCRLNVIDSIFRTRNIECHLLSPEDIKQLCPLLKTDDLVGGLWIPGDGVGDPYLTCTTLLDEAKKNGFTFLFLTFYHFFALKLNFVEKRGY